MGLPLKDLPFDLICVNLCQNEKGLHRESFFTGLSIYTSKTNEITRLD